MDNINQILRCIDYIEDNLRVEIKVKNLADFAGYSVFHFIRVFNEVTKYSPKDYILKRKISTSAKELKSNNSTILEIALDYGFNSHESFSRAFKRVTGLTPSDYKKNDADNMILTNKLNRCYLEFLNDFKNTAPQKLLLEEIELKGFSNIMEIDELTSENIIEYMDYIDCKDESYIVINNYKENKKITFIGNETNHEFQSLSISKGEYAEFESIDDVKQLSSLIKYAYEVWLPNSGFSTDKTKKLLRVKRDDRNIELSLLVQVNI